MAAATLGWLDNECAHFLSLSCRHACTCFYLACSLTLRNRTLENVVVKLTNNRIAMMKAVSLFVAVVVMGGVVNAADPTEVDHEQFLPFGKSSSPLIFTTFANRTLVPGYGLFLFLGGGYIPLLLIIFPFPDPPLGFFLFIYFWVVWMERPYVVV